MKKQPYPITDLTGGLSVNKDPLFIMDKESTNIVCARFDKGVLKKDMGWAELGLPLLGVPMLIDTYYKSDGIYRLLCFTTTSAYRYDSTLGEWVDITLGTEVCDCEDAWTASADVVSTADTTLYKKGSKSAKHVIATGFTTGLASYMNFASKDLTGYTHLHLWVYSTIALSASDASILLDNTNNCVSPLETIALPAIAANTWTRVSLALVDPSALGAIVSVGLSIGVDNGACTIQLDDIRAVLESTGTVTDFYSATTFMDTYVVTNYKDAPRKYTASPDYLELLGGSPPKMKSITTFCNRLVGCFTYHTSAAHPFQIRWSDPGTIETWTSSNYLEASDGADWCVSLNTLGGKCTLFKESTIWDLLYIGGTVVFQLVARVNQVSTMAGATISRIRELLAFFAYDGIYTYDQATVKCISDKIYPILFKTGEKTVNLGAVHAFNASYVEELREYWISLCEGSSTTPSLLFKYNLESDAYTKRTNKPITCIGYYERVDAPDTWTTVTGTWADAVDTWGKRSLPGNAATTLVGYNTGQIYEDDRYTTTTDQFIFETKDFMYAHATRVVECRVTARYGGFTIYYSLDGGITYIEGTTFTYKADWSEQVYYMNEVTQKVRFKIVTTEPTLEILWIEPWHVPRARSKELSVS